MADKPSHLPRVRLCSSLEHDRNSQNRITIRIAVLNDVNGMHGSIRKLSADYAFYRCIQSSFNAPTVHNRYKGQSG